MREADWEVFKKVAREKNVWLLVRLTNPKSLKWADEKRHGNDSYIPKPISCKAKTANIDTDGHYKIAGLVADPHHHRDKFTKLDKAMECWHDFSASLLESNYVTTGKGRRGYSVDIDPNSSHYFCVKRYGKYIHADYDLLDIIDAKNPRLTVILREIFDGVLHCYNPRFPEIQRILNARMDTPMVQHAGEAQFTGLSEQPIEVFFPRNGPNGEDYSHDDPVIWLNQLTAERWYQDRFGGWEADKPPKPHKPREQYPAPALVIPVDFTRKQRL